MSEKHPDKAHSFKKKSLASKKSKKQKDEITDQLEHIYQNADGSMPDMKHFERNATGRWIRALLTLVIACGILAVVAWAGFFLIAPQNQFSEKNVIVSVSGEEGITIGEETRYRIRYRNAQQIPLSQVRIEARYPAGFEYSGASVEPDGESNNVWTIGTLGANDSGFIDVTGKVFGNIDELQSVRVFFNYIPANFSSEFQKVATVSIEAAQAPVSLGVDVKEDIVSGVETPITIVVEQLDPAVSLPAKLAIEIEGEAFVVKGSDVKPDQFYQARWTVPSLDEPYTVAVRGVFLGDDDGVARVPIVLRGWSTAGGGDDESFVYASEQLEVTLLQESVQVLPLVNGGSSNVRAIPGDPLITSIVVKNQGESVIEDVRVRAIFDAPSDGRKSLLDWAELEDEAEGDIIGEQLNEQTRRGTITWDKQDVPALGLIAPGEDVTIDIRLPIMGADDTTLANYQGNIIDLFVDMQYTSGGQQEVYSSEGLEIFLESDASLEVRDEVSEDQKEHAITWIFTNNFHDLENVEIEAEIFGKTVIRGGIQVSAGEANLDGNSNKILWKMPELPTAIDVATLRMVLERKELDPSQSQLVSKISIKYRDVVTGEDVVLVGDEIKL